MTRISKRLGVAALALLLLSAPTVLTAAPASDTSGSNWGSALADVVEGWVQSAWGAIEGLVPVDDGTQDLTDTTTADPTETEPVDLGTDTEARNLIDPDG